jgi:hypothetical protein
MQPIREFFDIQTVIVSIDGRWTKITNPIDGNTVGRDSRFKGMSTDELVDFMIEEQNELIRKGNLMAEIMNSFINQTIEEVRENPNFAYFSEKPYGTAVYARFKYSPTGVINAYGFDRK